MAGEFGFLGRAVVLALHASVIFISLRAASMAHSHFARMAAAKAIATFAVCC